MLYFRNGTSFSECEAARRNRGTPAEAVDLLGLHEGDVVIIEVKHHTATLRPVRRSYAGTQRGVYGDADSYVKDEREAWR